MKIRIAFVLLFVGSMFVGKAQDSSFIVGKWAFEDGTESSKAKMDSMGLEMLPKFFGDMTIEFKEDGQYSFFFMNSTDVGTWESNKKGKVIELKSDRGEEIKLEVKELDGNKMEMKMPKGEFVMKRGELVEKE